MSLKLYNTLTRKKEIFKPIKNGEVGVYSCGPTVYWFQHVGNLRTYIFADLLRRILEFGNYKVKHIINITDVGHLTSDADSGEDKMEKAAKKEGKSAKEISEFYFDAFHKDLERLNVLEPTKWTKATEHIKEQIEIIKKLETKGFTYKTSDGIYFDTSKDKNYGKLARLKREGLQAGKRVDLGDKKNVTDFALWKFSPPDSNEKRQQEWDSPWGKGFPGWHIECSAMAMKYLGEHFDIHTGGQDHIQIHHTNEIAQSENSTGKKFVNYWMHTAWLVSKGEKISKSKGGLYTLSDLIEENFEPLSYRYFCLTTHYKKPLEFSLERLGVAQNTYKRLKKICLEMGPDKEINQEYFLEFEDAVNNDLDLPKAIQVLWKLVRDKNAKGKYGTIKKMDEVLGLDLLKKDKIKIPSEITELVKKREIARKNKDWKSADELRNKISNLGWSVEDKPEGPEINKVTH